MKVAVFTIASKNYFAYVRTIMQSLEKSNPHMDRYAVVVDELNSETGEFEKLPRNFELMGIDELNLPHPNQMKFRYDIMELNTAVKPFAILKLFETYDRVIYLDPDIFVYKKLQLIEDALDNGSNFVLTPHFNGLFAEDGLQPDEPSIMRAGIYNLGFIALNKCQDTLEMVSWWANKLEKQCVNEQEKGVFVDQKWIDLIPGFYGNVCILRHSGLNVAYWNLSHRKIVKKENDFEINGEPLIFFHFSGLDPNNIEIISKHQNRYMLKDLGDGAELFEEYAKIVLSNEFDMWKKFKYSYDSYTDGRKILDEHRLKYREDKRIQGYCGENPFKYADIFYGEKEIEFATDGVNLIGYLRSEHGLGEAARLTANCLKEVKINWMAYDYEVGNLSQKNDRSYEDKIGEFIKYNISILNINADQMFALYQNMPKELWDTYKIGIWYWELPEFPEKWERGFGYVDEIWAPTKFIAECLEKCAPCPVYHMPPGLNRNEVDINVYNREYFGLPKDAFLFLNMFDVYSFSGRKNPEAAVKAFKSAFDSSDMSVGLVLKINNAGYRDQVKKSLDELIEDYKNIYILSETMSREAVNGLINTCDVAVSLHRSEGLGLLCEEAMFYGKPVIATGWSGNMDFMTRENSCLVEYSICEVGEDIGPYEAWQKWADPSVSQAAEYMKRLALDKDYYESIAREAGKTIKEKFSPEICGINMQKRISEIQELLINGYQRNIERDTLTFGNVCAFYYQKVANKKLNNKERKQLVSSWIKGGTLDFDKIVMKLQNTKLATIKSDSDFIRQSYELFLERKATDKEVEYWLEYLTVQPKRELVLGGILRSEEFMGSYSKTYRKCLDMRGGIGQSMEGTEGPESSLQAQLKAANLTWQLPYYTDLKCSGIKLLLKRIIRKANKFLLYPLFMQQQEFNAHIVRYLNEMDRLRIEREREEKKKISEIRSKEEMKEKEIKSLFLELEQLVDKKNEELITTVKDIEESTRDSIIDSLRGEILRLNDYGNRLESHALEVEGSRHNQLLHYLVEMLERISEDKTGVVGESELIRQAIKDKWSAIDENEEKYNADDHLLVCPICKEKFSSRNVDKLISECIFNGGKLIRYRCPGCGVIFGPEKMFNLSDEQFANDYKIHYSVYKEGDSTKQEKELFFKLTPKREGVYLDWGAGAWSKTIEQLRKEGYQVWGYDPYAPVESDYIITDEKSLRNMKFDGIFSHDLLEHLKDPVGTFKLFSAILKPEGKMVHSTACFEYVYEYTRFHLFFYTGDSVDYLCRQTGFFVEKIDRDSVNLLIEYTFGFRSV